MQQNLGDALRFLQAYDEDLTFTFQVFDDSKKTNFAKHFTGNFEDIKDSLVTLNDSGNGIYFMLNRGDGNGRSISNVTHIRSLSVDLDGAPLGPVLECKLQPHFIVESSPGKYQAHWLIDPIPVSSIPNAKEKFAAWQVALAKKFGGDESVKDLCRVFRIPGFYHQKQAPFQSRIIESSGALPYKIESVIEAFGLDRTIEQIEAELKRPLPPISELLKTKWRPSERHEGLTKLAWKYVQRGLSPQESLWLLQEVNRKICEPPLDRPNELEDLVSSAYRKKIKDDQPIYCLAESWLSEPEVPPDQILKGVFDKGDKLVIIGKSKARKSFFVQQLAFSLVTGRQFLEFEAVKPRKVLLVQFEVKREAYKSRCIRMADALGIAPQELQGLVIVNARGLPNPEATIEAQALLHAPDVIIADPLYKLITGDENKSEDIKPVLKMFDSLAERTGAAIVYLHHDKKGSAGEAALTDRGAGSGILARDFDSAILLSPHKTSDDSCVVEFITRNYKSPEAFTTDWFNYSFSRSNLVPEKQTARSRASGKQAKLLELVEIAKKILTVEFESGITEIGLATWRTKLVEAGVAWKLVPAVIEQLEEQNAIEVRVKKRTTGAGRPGKIIAIIDPLDQFAIKDDDEIPF